MKSQHRFWILYSAAWVPYAASFVVVFVTYEANLAHAVEVALRNIIPAALLGVGVVRLCRRFPWSRERRAGFFIAHLVLAILYSTLWVTSVPLLFTIKRLLASGRWGYSLFTGYALQWEFFSGLMIYGTIASVVYVLQVTERLRLEEQRAARAEALRTRAELEALRAQLNPHFLFNTLHSLMALVRYDARAAEDALERLADLLRYALQAKRDEAEDVTFAEEWNFVQNYLALEELRLGNRLRIEARIEPATLGCSLPAFTLQPLVENAIKHSITTRPGGGVLRITSKLDSAIFRLEVRDDGPGAMAEEVADAAGLGLRLVRQRLEARYGDGASFHVETAPDAGFRVRVGIPSDMTPLELESEEEIQWQYAR